MKKHLLLLLSCAFTLLAVQASAQKTLTGRVAEADGTPLVGVTVSEAGTANGTFTDIDGNYSIKVKDENAVLSFSYTGRQPVTRPVAGLQEINVVLEEDAKILDEVVVTALGFEEKEDELGYASSTVSSGAVTGAAESTMINALSGKASGIRISRNSGDPGSGAYIQIRGISTIDRDAQPLIVVDGIPISNDSRGAQETFAAQSRLNDINPNDIESVTVLKGASAAALWGTKALGGVIVITTKGGQYNNKLSVTYKSSYSLDQINRRYPLQTVFGQGDNGVFNQRSRDSWGDKISERPGGADEFDTSGPFYVDQEGNTYYPILNKNSQELFNEKNFDLIFQ
ncbi:MAG: TonB-dependent receptor plug domain-containing protein, partial [Phaeodactylibacter sp.]|nr:TonB-dependent receptor plug domain-containing protein [Phaeodactylibacter sp.]